MKIFYSTAALFIFFTLVIAQEQSPELRKLEFLLGEWESTSVNKNTGAESVGHSSIQWVVGGQWLRWKFKAQMAEGPLEVLTLMNYQKEKRRYAFYSFNPMDDEPIAHYGNWLDDNTLRMETDFQDVKVRVEFRIKPDEDFIQEHSQLNPSGDRVIVGITYYSKISP